MRIYDEPWAPTPEEEARAETRRAIRTFLTAVVIVVLAIGGLLAGRVLASSMLGQCSPGWLTGADPQLCLNATASGANLNVSGTTSLPDGAIVELSVEETLGFQYWTTGPVDVAVAAGAFGRTFDVSGWGLGTATVFARFVVTTDQPQALRDRYHNDGSGLAGPDVQPDHRGVYAVPPMIVEVSTAAYVG